ncbi:SseB family protein [Streptomyces sp. NBC_00536]|uniref:SseB family protein n=1 Tax=Streptomyces sp. NBC_00536 TaxID=2975769 RepID=UPI002E7FE4B2|nr:SseB family protein [Streptomyces sp. NBC_00536]WUC80044.1 SseB family protein [Streptomyces sp. NBC_00536]
MRLSEEIAAFRGGTGNPARMLGEFRRATLLVPIADGGLMSGEQGGVRWVYAFTGEEALAAFARARGAGDQEWEYLAILGARLVDAVIPEVAGPAGVAVDVADEEGAMLFPPVVGIVPDAVAVDAAGPADAEPAGAPHER